MSISTNVLDFNVAIDRAVFNTQETLRRVFQRAALMCLGSIVVGDPPYSPGTPVDTGFARSNWYPVLTGGAGGSAPSDGAVVAEAGSDPMPAAINAVEQAQLGQTIWFVNTVPYIVALEYGHSQRQAPQGMVRLTLTAAQDIVDEAMAIERSRAAA